MNNGGKKNINRATAPKATLLSALIIILGFFVYKNTTAAAPETAGEDAVNRPSGSQSSFGLSNAASDTTPEPSPAVSPPATPEPLYGFSPRYVASTAPELLIKSTDIMVNGEITPEYKSDDAVDFGFGRDYSSLDGVITFRGNNFRDTAAYGTAVMNDMKFGKYWTLPTGSLSGADGTVWTGHGWTGQPLIVKWPKTSRQIMNMYDWAKEKEELVEVIYAAMDGKIYFTELESGSKTRDPLNIGYTFKGSGALDPRGYPILYVGAGYDSPRGRSRAFIISLTDGSIIHEFGHNENFALRSWPMFDSSPLIDAETDSLIYPGENGILYIIRLNTEYDINTGEIKMSPETVKWRYNGVRTGYQFWLGTEASAVIWRGHIIMPDNGGNLICLDLNTLKIDWVQDILDDSNSTPVLELEDGHPYIYISTSFHIGWRSWTSADVPIWKIDAVTGEIIWQTDYNCQSVQDVSGGVQGTAALGKNSLSHLVFMPVARTGAIQAGKLVALEKATGKVVWEFRSDVYSWSSPVDFYDADGRGYIIYCTSGGYMYLLDGLTGEKLDAKDLGGNIEASPAMYDNTVVVGTRAMKIWGITLN